MEKIVLLKVENGEDNAAIYGGDSQDVYALCFITNISIQCNITKPNFLQEKMRNIEPITEKQQ